MSRMLTGTPIRRQGRAVGLRSRIRVALFDALYGFGARYYDRITRVAFAGEWRRWQMTAMDRLPQGGVIVELGCGTGGVGRFGVCLVRAVACHRHIPKDTNRCKPPQATAPAPLHQSKRNRVAPAISDGGRGHRHVPHELHLRSNGHQGDRARVETQRHSRRRANGGTSERWVSASPHSRRVGNPRRTFGERSGMDTGLCRFRGAMGLGADAIRAGTGLRRPPVVARGDSALAGTSQGVDTVRGRRSRRPIRFRGRTHGDHGRFRA